MQQNDFETGGDSSQRLQWQRERNEQRLAQQKGMSLQDFRDEQQRSELEDDELPSEDDLEDVAIVVYYPDVRADSVTGVGQLVLKAKVSTLAIEGLTPEQAQVLANERGEATPSKGGGP